MINALLLDSSITRIVFVVLTTFLLAACNLDKAADETVTAARSSAVISGIDSGSITEDDDPDGDGLLEVSGQLNITDRDPEEAAFVVRTVNGRYGDLTVNIAGNWDYAADNNLPAIQNLGSSDTLTDILPVSSVDGTTHDVRIIITGTGEVAIISGSDNGSVTEDIDPDGDNLLEVSGQLSITDSDPGEAAFIARTVNGNYGNLTISVTGAWDYVADNSMPAIQGLGSSDTLTEVLTINSVDGTAHDLVVVIAGMDEGVVLSWTAPVEREDNQPLSLAEISGYTAYYGTESGQYNRSVTVNDGSAEAYVFTDLAKGTYYFVITTYDTAGRESLYSSEVTKTVF